MRNFRNRIIGVYSGQTHGPLMICLGGIHGNEPAGVKALRLLFKMLQVEPITNPQFTYKGRLIGIKGNVQGLKKGKRFVSKDLNRMFRDELIDDVRSKELDELNDEDRELRDLIDLIDQEIDSYKPDHLIVMDLHTTSCRGGIFSLVREEEDSIKIGLKLNAPVVRGMMNGIIGTTMHYFNHRHFDMPVTSLTFESGQHDEALSVNRAIAGIINCMRTIGVVNPIHVENVHDRLLTEFGSGLPKVTELVTCHDITEEDEFVMRPGYQNFQWVREGEHLADDRDGPVYASSAGLLLMPLYQKQGDEGFFILKESDKTKLPKSIVSMIEE